MRKLFFLCLFLLSCISCEERTGGEFRIDYREYWSGRSLNPAIGEWDEVFVDERMIIYGPGPLVYLQDRLYFFKGDGLSCFDPATEIWTYCTPPTSIFDSFGSMAATVSGEILFIASNPATWNPILVAYNPATDSWDNKAQLPHKYKGSFLASVNGELLLFGGCGYNSSIGEHEYKDEIWAYDPSSDTWDLRSPLPWALAQAETAVLNGRVYVFGGTRDGTPGQPVEVLVYDPVLETFTQLADFTLASWDRWCSNFWHAAVVGDRVYLAFAGSKHLFSFDTMTETWRQEEDIPAPEMWFASDGHLLWYFIYEYYTL